MNKKIEQEQKKHQVQSETIPRRVSLPGFIAGEQIGLGDVIKRTTSYFGIRTCGGCQQRAAKLNRWLVFTNPKPK